MKKIYILMGLLFFSVACEKEENPFLEEEAVKLEGPIPSNYVSGKDIPEIIKLIAPALDATSKSTMVATPSGTIDIENILRVTDTLGNTNYSFLIIPETPKPNSIYNLVVSVQNKTEKDLAILEYRMSDEFVNAFYNGTKDFYEFSGVIFKYPFNPNTYSNIFKESCVQNIDEVIICDEVPLANGGTGTGGGIGGGGGGAGDGTGSDPTGDEDGYDGGSGGGTDGSSFVVGWKCNAYGRTHPYTGSGSIECNKPHEGGIWIITILSHYKSSYKGLTCCDESYIEGDVGINLVTNAISNIYNCIGATPYEMGILGSMENTFKTVRLNTFLGSNNCSDEAKEFGALAKEAIVAGGDVDYVEQIIINLEGKALCVYNKLKSNSTSFKDAIQKFDGEFPVAHLKFSMDYTLPDSTNAVTDNGATNFIEIKINGNTISSRTNLGLARTMAHETLHAELYRKVRSVGGQVSINDFPGIYDYYRRYIKNWQHQQMAAHYRETIVDILKGYNNNAYSEQLYNDLAWEGLHNTVAWNQLSPTEKIRITNAIINFKNTGNKNCS